MTGSLRRERERARKTSRKGPAVPRRAFLIERFKGRWSTLFGATTIEEEEEKEEEEEEEKEVEEEAEEVMTEDEVVSPIATGLVAAGADDALLIARLRRSRMLTSRRRSRG